jgi:phosphotriesterase-related protein
MALHSIFSNTSKASGYILPHEHIFCDFTPVTHDSDHILNDKVLALRELAYFEQVGGATIVDITPPDLGRQPELLADIAEKTNLNIIMATGWYRKAFYPPAIDNSSTKSLAQAMITELIDGIQLQDGRKIKAGIIGEIGVDRDVVSALEERVLRAAAITSVETGAPISTHSSMYPVGIKQLEILQQYPISSNNIIIGHADTFLDQDYHMAIVDAGCYIQFDTIGRFHLNSDHDRAIAIMRLVERGYQDQILFSSDRCFRSDLKNFGGIGYDYIFTTFKALLEQFGLSENVFNKITQDNPQAALAW